MLAYTPLHLLLLEAVGRPLVMTSGNVTELPICTSNAEALEVLSHVAEAFLMHDREIVSRYDDSVIRVMDGAPVFLRRARGYAPLPIPLPIRSPAPLLAVGPHLKNTFALVAERDVFVSQHIGDLENLETLDHFRASLFRFRELFGIEPAVAVRGGHPGYLSTRVAEELELPRLLEVQHHHAHIAAVAAEHGRTDPVVGIAFDGTGYGDDGLTWGAEILLADLCGYQRVARLRYAPMPGGDLAARCPWRAAAGYLSLEPELGRGLQPAFQGVHESERRLAEAQIERRLNAPLVSSMGRLFDAAAAVLGVRRLAGYEGQAAMELETLAAAAGAGCARPGDSRRASEWPALPFPIRIGVQSSGEPHVMDPLPLLAELGMRAAAGEDRSLLAAAFHDAVGRVATELAERTCREHGVDTVAIGGGVFQNAILTNLVETALTDRGIRVLRPRALSPNDGSISYGQAAVAAARLSAESGR
jgi:hydrogenase maturation protein HypF